MKVYIAYYWEKEEITGWEGKDVPIKSMLSGFNCGEWELQTDPTMGIDTLGPLIINLQKAGQYNKVIPVTVIPLPLKSDVGILVPKIGLLS